jgi:hypothetical protein
MSDCTPTATDCIARYSCGSPVQPEDVAVMTPYVEIGFGGQTKVLMTGNSSAPPDNHAAIKSFEVGLPGGSPPGGGFKVEILDEGGTMYRRIIDAINKSLFRARTDTKDTYCRWGWITVKCNGSAAVNFSNKLKFTPMNVQTAFENGLIKLTFEGTQPRWADVRLQDNMGDEEEKMPLRQAIEQLFRERAPQVMNVEWEGAEPGSEFLFNNSDGDQHDGPRGVWPTDQQNPLSAARKWLSGVTTSNGKGILIIYDPENFSVLIKEDPNTDQSGSSCCLNSIGTYIVNGGNFSPVLSFNPQITWPAQNPANGGTSTGSASGNSEVMQPDINIERTGSQTGPTIQQHEWMWRNPDEMSTRTTEAFGANMQAEKPYTPLSGIQAELKIIGDPSFDNPRRFTGRWVSIIVINPFYVCGNVESGECTWLATSNCNAVLSNKKWQIQAVNHQISAGSYVTTLKVMLPQPNSDIDVTEPLGGNNCGGYRAPNIDSTPPPT